MNKWTEGSVKEEREREREMGKEKLEDKLYVDTY